MDKVHRWLSFVSISAVLFGASCATSQTASENRTLSNEMILEVKTEASETIYPPGKTLDLRVFGDRRVEFDFYPLPTPEIIDRPFASKLKTSNIGQADFDSFMNLLARPDLQTMKDRYAPTKPIFDSQITTTITFKTPSGIKRVVLQENDSHLRLEGKSGIYPESLIELLKLVYNVGARVRQPLYEQEKKR